MYVELDHPQRGKWFNVGMPIKLSDFPGKDRALADCWVNTPTRFCVTCSSFPRHRSTRCAKPAHLPRTHRKKRASITRCAPDKKTKEEQGWQETKRSVRKILDKVKAEGRTSLTAPEGKLVCDAYGIAVPKEGVATSAAEASKLAAGWAFRWC